MTNILNDNDIFDCLFDFEVEVSDLPSDNNSFDDNSDAEQDFITNIPSVSNITIPLVIVISPSSSDNEDELPIPVPPKKKK